MTARPLTPTDHVQICDGVSDREFDGEWVLLDLAGGNYFGLDDIAGKVWNGLREGKTPREIAALLHMSYDVAAGKLLEDILRFADDLVGRGLVRIKE